MELTLRIHDPSGTTRRDVRVDLQEGSTVVEFVDALVELLGWPRETMDGEALTYAARRLGEHETMLASNKIGALGLVHGEAVVLGPVLEDGRNS